MATREKCPKCGVWFLPESCSWVRDGRVYCSEECAIPGARPTVGLIQDHASRISELAEHQAIRIEKLEAEIKGFKAVLGRVN